MVRRGGRELEEVIGRVRGVSKKGIIGSREEI